MNCPIEKSELIDHTESGLAFHFCGECHGMFFTKEELLKCLRLGKVATESPAEPVETYDVTQVVVQRCCPACQSTTMLDKILDDIAIDICPDCKGVWLDAGELDKIVERHQRKQQESGKNSGKAEEAARDELWNADAAGDAVAVFFDGAGDWLGETGSSVSDFFSIDF
jgi:Zn-finger nucleic acid-binding protein